MKALLQDVNIDIGNGINNKSLVELQNEFSNTFKRIQHYKHDPSCEQYHKLYDHLIDVDHQILCHPDRG